MTIITVEIRDLLDRFCDLTPAQYLMLRDLAACLKPKLHPATRLSLEDKGLIDGGLIPTDWGRALLERADDLVERRVRPPEGRTIDIQHLQRAVKTMGQKTGYPKFRTLHVNTMICLVRNGYLAYGWLCRIFGADAVRELLDAGLVEGMEWAGAVIELSFDGQEMIRELEERDKDHA